MSSCPSRINSFDETNKSGRISAEEIKTRLRNDTLLTYVMHVNNETGVIQPISEIAAIIADHSEFLHIDAAQGFGKEIATLQNSRIDSIAISRHKIYAPKGVGALITHRRGYKKMLLQPLIFGGGQERDLRTGTLSVHLVAGLGLATELGLENHEQRNQDCQILRQNMLDFLIPLNPITNGDLEYSLPNVINSFFAGIDSEALMLTLKDEIAISTGSACTSHSY